MPLTRTDPLAERISVLLEARRWHGVLEGIDLLYGPGTLAEIGETVSALGARHALLVTDPGIRAAGHVERALDALSGAGIETTIFDDVEENPTAETLERGVDRIAGLDVDVVVGLGGGSAMDAAKGIDLILTNGGRIGDYEGFGHVTEPLLPGIGVPTTAGTGSEAQSYALITDPMTHRKIPCGDPKMRFQVVVLDPELLGTAPGTTRAASGLDAVSHALESFVTSRRTPESTALARTAWSLLDRHLEEVLVGRDPREATGDVWGALQLAAFLAGAAIERSMLGAAHACANPLTARYGTVHGAAVALMLPAVVRYNGGLEPDPYSEIGDRSETLGPAEAIARRVETLRAAGGLPSRLAQIGVTRRDLAELARQAKGQWTLAFNPRPASEDDLVALYEATL